MEKQQSLDLDRFMPSLIYINKWRSLNFEELKCLPGLQEDFGICWRGIVLRQTGACCGLLEIRSLFGWVAAFWRFPLTACSGLVAKISKKCCGASLRPKRRGDCWMGQGGSRPTYSGCCCSPFLSQAKWALALQGQYICSPAPCRSARCQFRQY